MKDTVKEMNKNWKKIQEKVVLDAQSQNKTPQTFLDALDILKKNSYYEEELNKSLRELRLNMNKVNKTPESCNLTKYLSDIVKVKKDLFI